MQVFYKVKKAYRYLKHFGWKEFWNHVKDRLEPEDVPYDPWFHQHQPDEKELEKMRKIGVPGGPLISVVIPCYKTPKAYLEQLLEAFKAQTYENFELCLADASPDDSVKIIVDAYASDQRIRYQKLTDNAGIAQNTNQAVAMATGDYIGFMDHDDLIAPHTLYRVAEAIVREGADLLYTDEDKVTHDLKKHFQPHFKPDFNLDLLRSNNYITHFLVVKRSLIGDETPFDPAFDGAQDYDFIFRMTEKASKICHIPEILYHWRTHEASTADNPMSKLYAYEAGKRAIEGNLRRSGTAGEVELLPDYGFYRVHYPVENDPLLSIIIPNKDHVAALKTCLEGIRQASYKNVEILIVENNSEEDQTFAYYDSLADEKDIRVLRYQGGFNYSAINNFGVREAKGDYLLFLNNDVRGVITPDWISEMLGVCQRKDVGCVGARLYYPNDTIQHAGCVIGMGGVAGAMFVGLPKGRSGYLHKAAILQDLSAVTAACMMVPASVFNEVGGFTEELTVSFNDMDLCLKIGKAGYRVVYDPYAELYHDESLSRGPEDNPEKVRRFQEEIEYMRVHWLDMLKNGDPNYNPNLSLKKWHYSLKV
ncbi:MAG: glycosyltransferase family 2 protein [Lachnospiraceae bacterium]|nr:glycosyltransferase family 2 protein [Candidatus Equihabitans merdae]